jgi:hypothetical protein
MRDNTGTQSQIRSWGPQVLVAIERLEGILLEGLRHGFFDCSIACEISNGGKRELIIRAGKSYKFTIPENELLK